jgi:hypothetical protein
MRPDRRAHNRRGRSDPPQGHAPGTRSRCPSTGHDRLPAAPHRRRSARRSRRVRWIALSRSANSRCRARRSARSPLPVMVTAVQRPTGRTILTTPSTSPQSTAAEPLTAMGATPPGRRMRQAPCLSRPCEHPADASVTATKRPSQSGSMASQEGRADIPSERHHARRPMPHPTFPSQGFSLMDSDLIVGTGHGHAT